MRTLVRLWLLRPIPTQSVDPKLREWTRSVVIPIPGIAEPIGRCYCRAGTGAARSTGSTPAEIGGQDVQESESALVRICPPRYFGGCRLGRCHRLSTESEP